MQDWVKEYLPKKDPLIFEGCLWDQLKEVNFNCLQERDNYRDKSLYVSGLLMGELRCQFSGHTQDTKHNTDNFKIIFASVLADLEKHQYDTLCKMQNAFFVYAPTSEVAYTAWIALMKPLCIEKGKGVKVAIFTDEIKISPDFRLATRGVIVHELIHVIKDTRNENQVNQIAKEWNFAAELDEAKRVYLDIEKRPGLI